MPAQAGRRPHRGGFLEVCATQSAAPAVAPWADYAKERIDIAYESNRERDAMMDTARTWVEAREGRVRSVKDGGVRLDLAGPWTLAQPSRTEPLLRVYAEAKDAARASDLANE
jgi:phosphomannomutase/phosphoglucomutase